VPSLMPRCWSGNGDAYRFVQRGASMNTETDLEAIAKSIIDSNVYMTLGTADEDGQPWVSPVYYASNGHSEFHWVSSPEALHSRNLTARPNVSIVIFDSQVRPGTGQAVYMSAVAEELSGADVDRGLELYPGPAERGGWAFTSEQVRPPGVYRLYRATVSQHWVLEPGASPDQRTTVTL